MMLIKSAEILTQLEVAMAPQVDEQNPFVRVGLKMFMRYDALQVSQDDGEMLVSFMWKGVVILTERVRGDLCSGATLNILSVEGKLPVVVR